MRLQRALRRDLIGLGLPFLEGEGGPETGRWEPEESFLILGLEYQQALHLGRHYEQNAIMWAEIDAVPRLILLQ